MQKILVTGGTGYIGSHTVVELLNAGFETIIADNLSNSDVSVLDSIQKITGIRPSFECIDLCDLNKLEQVIKKYGKIDGIIHFAAFKAVGESVSLPIDYYYNNICSLLNVLKIQKKFDIHNLVFSSSCTVYGQPDILPVTEDTPVQKAGSPYGNTKQICEEIIEDTIKATSNLQAISLRYFNPIGSHDTALIGELPKGTPNNLVPIITQTAIGKRKEFHVYGCDYNTPDGSCIRDYISVVDLAKAHVKAITRLLNHATSEAYEVYNLGTGKGQSVMEIIRIFEKVSGCKLNYKIVDRRPGDSEKIWADTSLAQQKLDWKAEKTIEEMLLSAWKWELNLAIN